MFLDENVIRLHLQQAGFTTPFSLYVLESVDSTNRYLKDLVPHGDLTLCCAEAQTQGRGRLQRTWYSPHAENIYCSIRWHISKPSTALSTLSLVISLAILQTLKTLGIAEGIRIKWPNDLLWQDKKFCGILIETSQHPVTGLDVIIGIGLNVNSDSRAHQSEQAPQKPWCSLYDITQQTMDRNSLIAQLLIHMQHAVTLFLAEGFAPFLSQWQASDYLQDKTVKILQGNQIIEGIAQGINVQGELLVLDQQQILWQIASGEASVLSR